MPELNPQPVAIAGPATGNSASTGEPPSFWRDTTILLCVAGATVVVHLLTGWRYGFHRDELATLDDARHMAWGYVSYPPVTPFLGRLSLALFGTSLVGFRFFAALAQSAAVLLPEWHGWHAVRRGLGSNLYRLGVPDMVIQRIRIVGKP